MTEFLVRHFVKDYEAVEKSAVRTAYGVLASMVGIVCNVFLFLVKFIVGLFAAQCFLSQQMRLTTCQMRHLRSSVLSG